MYLALPRSLPWEGMDAAMEGGGRSWTKMHQPTLWFPPSFPQNWLLRVLFRHCLDSLLHVVLNLFKRAIPRSPFHHTFIPSSSFFQSKRLAIFPSYFSSHWAPIYLFVLLKRKILNQPHLSHTKTKIPPYSKMTDKSIKKGDEGRTPLIFP